MNRLLAEKTCPHCDSAFLCDRNEDGQPEIPNTLKCADQDCQVRLCPAGCEHLSFVCAACDRRFCDRRARAQCSGNVFCGGCWLEVVHLAAERRLARDMQRGLAVLERVLATAPEAA